MYRHYAASPQMKPNGSIIHFKLSLSFNVKCENWQDLEDQLPFSFFSDDDLEKLIEEVVKASNRGVSAARNASGEPNWSFGQSLFFSSTVVTTIGNNFVSICGHNLKNVTFSPVEVPIYLYKTTVF